VPRATTVLELFLKGVQSYGLPSRVRADQGGENTLVSEYIYAKTPITRSWMRKLYHWKKHA